MRMRAMQQIKKASATTKGVLTGDADAYVRRFQIQLDQFVEDLERFDEALWVFVHDYKEKLYKFLELFMQKDPKNGNKNLDELKKSFSKLQSSASKVAKDLERTVNAVRTTKADK
jgi:hypothetical protein